MCGHLLQDFDAGKPKGSDHAQFCHYGTQILHYIIIRSGMFCHKLLTKNNAMWCTKSTRGRALSFCISGCMRIVGGGKSQTLNILC